MNALDVNTPFSCVTVGVEVEVGRGGEVDVESPGAGGDEGGGGDVEVAMGKWDVSSDGGESSLG